MYIIENDYTSTTPIEFLEHEGIKLARRDTSKGIKWYFLEDDENLIYINPLDGNNSVLLILPFNTLYELMKKGITS